MEMGGRAIQEINKNKKKEKGMSEGKKIEIEVPEDYELVQDGMNIKFVKSDKRFLKWGEKDNNLSGYCIDRVSEVYAIGDCPRFDLNRKTFAKESQAEGMIAMAVLSQQLADVNQGWEPDWKKDGCKWCIHSELVDGHFIFVVAGFWHLRHFLTFKTKEDAEKFLAANIKEINFAKDFL